MATATTAAPINAATTTGPNGPKGPKGACLTVRQVADELHVSVRQVWRWTKSGELPHVRLGKKAVRVTRIDLDAFIAQHRRASFVAPPGINGQDK